MLNDISIHRYFPQQSSKLEQFIVVLLRFAIGIIFVYSGSVKLFQEQSFINVLLKFQILPEAIVLYFATALSIVELFLGLCLLLGICIRATILSLSLLLIVFIAAISITLIRGISVNCGCFGSLLGSEIGFKTLTVDFVLLVVLGFLATRKRHSFSIG